jgi:hypothetical protein
MSGARMHDQSHWVFIAAMETKFAVKIKYGATEAKVLAKRRTAFSAAGMILLVAGFQLLSATASVGNSCTVIMEEKIRPGFHLHIDNPPWTPLNIEEIGSSGPIGLPTISVAHFGQPNGDTMQWRNVHLLDEATGCRISHEKQALGNECLHDLVVAPKTVMFAGEDESPHEKVSV